jgi:hypothetical protein
MALARVGVVVRGERLNRVDCHSVDGSIEVDDPEPDGTTNPDEWNESAHSPIK